MGGTFTPERVTIVDEDPPPFIWSTDTQRIGGYNATGGYNIRTPTYP